MRTRQRLPDRLPMTTGINRVKEKTKISLEVDHHPGLQGIHEL
jgi:hypothetical protein